MSLTVTEREHWKDLICKRVDEKIETLWHRAGDLKKELKVQAKALASDELGITEGMAEVARMEAEIKKMERALTNKRRSIQDQLEPDEDHSGQEYAYNSTVQNHLKPLTEHKFKELAAATPTGAAVQKLKAEKERATESIWLATTTAAVKELWGSLLLMLDVKPASLEEKAMNMPPDPAA